MKLKFLIYIINFLFPVFVLGQTFPQKPNRLVNDYTNTLSAAQINQLEQKLVAFDDSTTTQVAVVLIKSLEGYDVADYATRLAESWGIGGTKNNNGVLLLVSIGDRKVTIQTGYGVEGALPDAIARRIIENEITPQFRAGSYFGGLDKGTDAIIAYTKGEYKNTNPKRREGAGTPGIGVIIFIIILILFIIKGGGGGGRKVIGSRGGDSPFWWLLLGSQLGRGGGGGFGGFSGGSGGGGGGFGGFGGGSFGGGGASGSW